MAITEEAKFEMATGGNRKDFEELLGCKIILQGESLRKEMDYKRYIFIGIQFPSSTVHPIEHRRSGQRTKLKKVNFPEAGNCILDISCPIHYTDFKFVDENTHYCVARKDVNGNIIMSDFYHYFTGSQRAKAGLYGDVFMDIISQCWEADVDMEEIFLKRALVNINELKSEKIERVVVTTSFDKDAFILSARKEMSQAVKDMAKLKDYKIVTYKNQLIAERENTDTRIKQAEELSFLEGLKGLRDGWEIRDNRLYYTKKIVAKTLHREGETVDMGKDETFYINGLNITIKPWAANAMSSDCFHPNATDGTLSDDGETYISNVCLGDLESKPLHLVLAKIPEMLEVAGLNAPHSGVASRLARMIWIYDTDKKKEYQFQSGIHDTYSVSAQDTSNELASGEQQDSPQVEVSVDMGADRITNRNPDDASTTTGTGPGGF